MNEVSEKQLEANRQNAKLGGVKTDEGKGISKYNALKHGILTEGILMVGESKKDLEELGQKLRDELDPANEMEMILVERIISSTWRLRRAVKGEREMIEHDMEGYSGKISFGQALSNDLPKHDSYGKFTRYETCLERGIYRALHELQRLKAARNGEKPPLPIAIDIDLTSKD